MDFRCETCSKTFELKINLQNHIRLNHRDRIFTCSYCGNKSKFRQSIIRHIKVCLRNPNAVRRSHVGSLARKTPMLECPLCTFQCKDRAVMIVHYADIHGVQIAEEHLEFADFKAFEDWKRRTESSGNFRFSKQQLKKSRRGLTYSFRCFRDGFFKPRGKSIRRLKTQGSYKMNGVCPCSLKITISSETGAIDVTYIASHVGHAAIDIEPSKKKRQQRVANKLSKRIQTDNIRDALINGDYSQLYLTSSQDLAIIKKSLQLFQVTDGRLCADDAKSLETWISSTKGSSNIVRFYKPQSVILPGHPELHYEDCLLIFAHNSQINKLIKFGSNVICIDGSQGTYPHNFELHALLVKDGKNQCIPCAFMVSNRSDAQVISIFVTVVKKLLHQPIVPRVLVMSDQHYSAWVSVMPTPEYWLVCQWHVDQEWKKNLAKINNLKKRSTAYKILRTLLDEPDENTFNLLLRKALAFMASDPDLAPYEHYFRSQYCSITQLWAFCFCKHLEINMDTMLESMCNVMKRLYLDGKKVKPLDKGIDDLLQFVLDKFQDEDKKSKENVNSRILAMRDRHAKSVNLKTLVVSRESGSDWLISSSSRTAMYKVKKIASACDCKEKCEVCAVCIHQYQCTCIDFLKSNLCKHIHRIVTWSNQNELADVGPLNVSDDDDDQEDCDTRNLAVKVSATSQNVAKAKEALTKQFFDILQSANSLEAVEEIKKALAPVPEILVLKSLEVELRPFTRS